MFHPPGYLDGGVQYRTTILNIVGFAMEERGKYERNVVCFQLHHGPSFRIIRRILNVIICWL